jgi:pyruvate,orthophosphate dikinase
MERWIRLFNEGDATQKSLLGNKGANLAEMTRLGLPIPSGFVVTTDACREYFGEGNTVPEGMWDEVATGLKAIEFDMEKTFGDAVNPLLLSVRSGAAISMPGMMETVLNLGLNDTTVEGLTKASGDERFAWDSYRRLIQMYGKVVLGVNADLFEKALAARKAEEAVEFDADLSVQGLKKLEQDYREIIRAETGHEFPDDPWDQLKGAIEAVFRSWNTQRAINYRRQYRLPVDLGTGVNVQAMVYGNLGEDSATGVAFTRDPATGERKLVGEYLKKAQGEDVVAGIRTPQHLDLMADDPALAHALVELQQVSDTLEAHYKETQDVEFTVEQGRLWMLQTRTAKRTGHAAVKIAVDMVREGLIDQETAVKRVAPEQFAQLLHPTINPTAKVDLLATGLAASPGAASGVAVFDADEAVEMQKAGTPVIMVRRETSPEDFHGMVAAQGFVTAFGGTTSHAAVVARGMGKPCVAGAGALDIHEAGGFFQVGKRIIRRLEWLTIDGSTGRVLAGKVPMRLPESSEDSRLLLEWADKIRTMKVRANADTPEDAENALNLGAEGIGLCRTEHMFFKGDRIQTVREMILADTEEERDQAIDKLLPLQREDFLGIFRAMRGLPVTIRTLDPPLHEFLPHTAPEEANLAWQMGLDVEVIRTRIAQLRESNPMLGFRGCRLGIAYPHITEMQAKAIFSAACQVVREGGSVQPEVMIPLVSSPRELELQRAVVVEAAEAVFAEEGMEIPYTVGTMIELPRAAVLAGQIAEYADFFSFGTNDLTQMTMGMSRDDSGRFLPSYVSEGIYQKDPFTSLDVEGVGQLVQMGVERGRTTKPHLKVGVCGEVGGDPESIAAFASYGMDYVSCSPFRVPIARLAAAHVAHSTERVEGSAW